MGELWRFSAATAFRQVSCNGQTLFISKRLARATLAQETAACRIKEIDEI